jgi:TPR repeat protein
MKSFLMSISTNKTNSKGQWIIAQNYEMGIENMDKDLNKAIFW